MNLKKYVRFFKKRVKAQPDSKSLGSLPRYRFKPLNFKDVTKGSPNSLTGDSLSLEEHSQNEAQLKLFQKSVT